ncbi:unnamed protein product [Fusarium fujikuroi]|uniref:Rhodopsin domain-containing protein n=1 Tax=Fusarium fujikuroi TaxID=5127 RepID=A0A9Q9RUU0_FUSFU|nr:unnamed protein product [Fusarium fujikuroi]VZI01779.1 unnamed protein product [Fusarium fujikuroi]
MAIKSFGMVIKSELQSFFSGYHLLSLYTSPAYTPDIARSKLALLFCIALYILYYYYLRYNYFSFYTKDLLNGHKRNVRWAIYGLNALNIVLMIAIFLNVVFQTIPINAFWDVSITPERQINRPAFYISSAIITIFTDILILLIPFWIFLGLKMRLAIKLGLMVVFLIGGIVTIIAILRIIQLYKGFYLILLLSLPAVQLYVCYFRECFLIYSQEQVPTKLVYIITHKAVMEIELAVKTA